ncbi:hypothetical protein DH2020_042747 [Rehmannia glutinosa]|uniref:Uncharacterized protein n=1 Tax=Rehmannia glutinosa TaxID=99300 RepID=A0ABR0UNK0_REHGL
MINEEGAEEKPTSAVNSSWDPSWDRESDGGDDLSHYSSCGGESEFDRYCSASSAMGTPSFRGSSYQDSDFGSLRSFKLGGGEFRCDGKDNGTLKNLNGKMEGFVVTEDVDFRGNFDVDGNWGNKGNTEGIDRNLSDEGESSPRYEHSEGEDSMFGCGSDDEKKIDLYYGKNVLLRGAESGRKENQLVMNSAVAFGSDDWDDFVQESRENINGSMVWDEIQAERKTRIQSGIGSSSFTGGNFVTHPNTILEGRQNEVRNIPKLRSSWGWWYIGGENANAPSTNSTNLVRVDAQFGNANGVLPSSNQVSDMDELAGYLGCTSGYNYNLFQTNKDPPEKEVRRKRS